jgi:DNA invertase Pin-like site-specific DNA recombinase
VPDRYDDGGVSGGTLERSALKRLLADIERGQVDVVVVYKVDRLSRAIMGTPFRVFFICNLLPGFAPILMHSRLCKKHA